jgi:hypothetical protein
VVVWVRVFDPDRPSEARLPRSSLRPHMPEVMRMPPRPSTLVIFFGLTIFNWVLLPALALLVETVPFLRETNSPARSEA